jgi:polyisoprenoid-binding protein YceI
MEDREKNSVWLIDPVHSKIRFETKYLLITSISGWFTEFEGTVVTAADDFNESKIQLCVYTNSIYTGNAERDNHLRSADFFDTRSFPMLYFRSNSISIKGDKLDIIGELQIKGKTETIELAATFLGDAIDPGGNRKAGFETRTVLNRKDFDITWNQLFDKAGVLLSDEVKVFCDIQLLKIS